MAGPSLLSCGGAHLILINRCVHNHASKRILQTTPPPARNLLPIPRTSPAFDQAPQQPGGASLRTCLRSDQGRYFLPRTVPANVSTPRPIHHLKNGDTPAINVTSHTSAPQDSDGTKETIIAKRQSSIVNTAAERSSGGMASRNTSTGTVVQLCKTDAIIDFGCSEIVRPVLRPVTIQLGSTLVCPRYRANIGSAGRECRCPAFWTIVRPRIQRKLPHPQHWL